MSEIDKEQ